MKMKKVLTQFTIYCLLFTLLNAASVEAIVANNEVVQGNMAQLKIVAHGDRAAFPNITEIGGSKVLGRHQSSNNSMSYINGKMTTDRSTSLILTFAPQHDMTIPSYSVNIDGTVYKTDPIVLKVVKTNAPKVANSNKFSLQLRADKKSVLVGEPLIVTVFFSVSKNVRLSQNPDYTKPDFGGFFVKELGNEKTYMQGNYQVTEIGYLLTPKKEGNFTVGPATAKVGVADTSRRDMFGRFFGTVWTPIASNTVNIEVKPIPQDTDLVGSFRLDSSIDKEHVKANKPVNLTVKIEGEGNLEDFEFPAYELDGVTIYSDDAKIETQIINEQLKSNYVKKFVFISDHDFHIPARSFSVYDTKKGEVTTLEVPAYEIKVEGNKAVATTIQTTPDKGVVQTNLKQVQESQNTNVLPTEEKKGKKNIAWWTVTVAFVLGMLVMYLTQFLKKFKREPSPYKEDKALKILYGHMSEDKEIEAMVRKLYAKKNGDRSVQIDKKELKEMVERFR
jgi:hypothetical protein